MRRLDSNADRIEGAHKRLIDRRADLIREALSRSLFACPAELQERITHLNLLDKHARSRNLQDFLTVYKRAPIGVLAGLDLKTCVQRLSSIPKSGLNEAARRVADKVAYPSTRGWWIEYHKYIKAYTDQWQTVLDMLRHKLAEVVSEHRVLEKRYNALLMQECERCLTVHVADLREAVGQDRGIVTEAQEACSREAAAMEAVRKVWQGTLAGNRYVYRHGEPLDEDDRILAGEWAKAYRGDGFSISAMESARCAELVALNVYREIFGAVEDLSILQRISPSDPRWQTADLTAGGRWIDVKNARRSFSSRNSYSEHCVKRFKSDGANHQVVVSGFLSEYHPDGAIGTGEKVVWLGETTRGTIEKLRSLFETDYLQLDFSGRWANRIPPWLFDYPHECYSERNAALATVRSHGFVLPRSHCPLGFLVLFDRVERALPENPLSEEALTLSRRLAACAISTRPMLFLHILDRFCHTVRESVPFPSKSLRQILFPAESLALPECSNYAAPLAILDPLETVKELLDVLERVADHCAQRAVAFTSFKLAGAGIFQGRHKTGNWQTIFAYCGGWRSHPRGGRVKCGQNPLFIGQNELCEAVPCGKLICHECGYCSQNCRHCPARQEKWSEQRRAKAKK